MNSSFSHLARSLALLLLSVSPLFAESADELFNRGFELHMQGKLPEAVRYYSDAIDEVPTFAMAFQMRALAHQQLKKYPNSISDYSNAITHGELSFQVVGYYNRGIVKSMVGNFNEAIDDFSQAILLNKKMAAAFFHRGIARHQVGDDVGRLEDFRQAAILGDRTAEQWLNTYLPNWRQPVAVPLPDTTQPATAPPATAPQPVANDATTLTDKPA